MFTNCRFSVVAKTVAKMFVAVFFSTFLAKRKNRKRKKKRDKVVSVDKETFSSIDASFYISMLSEFVSSLYMIYRAFKAFKAFNDEDEDNGDDYILAFNSAFFGWGSLFLTVLSVIFSVVYTVAIVNTGDLDFFNSYYYYIPVVFSGLIFNLLRLLPVSLLLKFYPHIFSIFYLGSNSMTEFSMANGAMDSFSWISLISSVFGSFLLRSVSFYYIKEHVLKSLFYCI